MREPDEAERQRVGEKFKQLAEQLRANEQKEKGRKRFTPYTDDKLRALYPAQPAQEAAE